MCLMEKRWVERDTSQKDKKGTVCGLFNELMEINKSKYQIFGGYYYL